MDSGAKVAIGRIQIDMSLSAIMVPRLRSNGEAGQPQNEGTEKTVERTVHD